MIPQSFYYHYAYSKLENKSLPVVFSVPSGNLGNITAGLFAKEMGLPACKFIAAVNANNIVPEYIRTSVFTPKPSVATLSNAMDVGNPSNFQRISSLFNKDYEAIKELIYSNSYSDSETLKGIKEVLDLYDYTIDPHGAVGYLALKDFLKEQNESFVSIILETAHPAKFNDTVTSAIGKSIIIPEGLKSALDKKKHSIKMIADYNHLRDFLKGFE